MDRFSDWLLEDRLPAEGRVEVWRARADSGESVTLRRLPGPVLLGSEEQSAFERGIERLRGVTHPGLLPLQAGGEHDRDLFVVTGAPPDGMTSLQELRRRARPQGGLTVGQVLRIGESLAGALHAIHEAEAFHGGLSAQAVFIGDDGVVLLGRLGVAAIEGADVPEPWGVADDVRRLGTILWEALVDRRLLFGVADPPSVARPDVPAAVDAVLARALATDPTQRFASAAAFAEALANAQGVLAGKAANRGLTGLTGLGVLDGTSPAAARRDEATPRQPRHLDIPIFQTTPSRLRPSHYVLAARISLVAAVGLIALMMVFLARSSAGVVTDESPALKQQAPRATPRADPRERDVGRLVGPTGDQASFPPSAPTLLQVWLPNCADCMAKFNIIRRLSERGDLRGLPIVNISYGRVEPSWARQYGVAENLVTDAGATIVMPLGIGTFTSLVMYPDGSWVRVPVNETSYVDDVKRALRNKPAQVDGVWPPRR